MSTLVINTRSITTDDAASLAELYKVCWQSTYQGIIPQDKLEEIIKNRPSEWWHNIAKKTKGGIAASVYNGKIVGYTSQGLARRKELGFSGEVFEIYVHPEYQGIGLGKDLFMTAAHKLMKNGHKRIHMWVPDDNESAHHFAKSLNGKQIACAKQTFGDKTILLKAYGFLLFDPNKNI